MTAEALVSALRERGLTVAVATRAETRSVHLELGGDRTAIRRETVARVIQLALDTISE